jgi:hypothetical protein
MKNDLKTHILDKLNDMQELLEVGYEAETLEEIEKLKSFIEDVEVS